LQIQSTTKLNKTDKVTGGDRWHRHYCTLSTDRTQIQNA